MKHIHFKPATHKDLTDMTMLEAGDTFTLRGQPYEVWGVITTVSAKGHPYTTLALTTTCCECGETFEVYPKPEAVAYLSKRCKACAAPGKASDGKGRFVKRDW